MSTLGRPGHNFCLPFFSSHALRDCIRGNKYANVFPDPVWSAIMQCRTFKTLGKLNAWILLGRSTPCIAAAAIASSDAPSSANVFILQKFSLLVFSRD